MPSESDPPTLSAQQVGKYLRISLSTVHHLTRTGKLRAAKQGKRWIYLKSEIERFLDEGFSEWISKPAPVNSEERRAFPRTPCFIEGQMSSGGDLQEKTFKGRILNISQHGILFEVEKYTNSAEPDFLPADGKARFLIPVSGKGTPYILQGLIVRREPPQDGNLRLGVHLETSALLLLGNMIGYPAIN